MRQFAVSAIGRDRPGIVAGFTRTLLEHGVNIEDSQMSILRGHFSMMLIVSAPDAIDAERLSADLSATGDELGLEALSVGEVSVEAAGQARSSHVITVYGADHPGILHAVSAALAELGVNIVDLTTRLVGDEDAVYVAVIEVLVPDGVDDAELDAKVRAAAEHEHVELSIRDAGHEAL
jgi:glycine cleavage system transcriptional repressor